MKSIVATLSILVVALLLVVYILSTTVMTSPPEVKRTSSSSSSYEQKTNHFPMPSYNAGPIQGSETPYQVNQWASYAV